MLKRILLAVSLLLWAESTGYAASGMIREMMESGIPAARRALSTVRPLASLFTFQPSVPVVPSSTHVVKRYFSKAAVLYSSVEVMDKREGLRGAFSSSVVSNIPNKMTEDKMTDEEFFVLPAHEAVEVFLKNCNTEVAEVDEGLAYIGEKFAMCC